MNGQRCDSVSECISEFSSSSSSARFIWVWLMRAAASLRLIISDWFRLEAQALISPATSSRSSRGILKALPGLPRDLISLACRRSATGSPPCWTCQEKPPQWVVWDHLNWLLLTQRSSSSTLTLSLELTLAPVTLVAWRLKVQDTLLSFPHAVSMEMKLQFS